MYICIYISRLHDVCDVSCFFRCKGVTFVAFVVNERLTISRYVAPAVVISRFVVSSSETKLQCAAVFIPSLPFHCLIVFVCLFVCLHYRLFV